MSSRRSRSASHSGVSITALEGGRQRLRWREPVEGGGWRERSWTVHATAGDANLWALRIHEAVTLRGTFERPSSSTRPTPPRVADLEELHLSFAEWKAVNRRLKPRTIELMRMGFERFEAEIRIVTGLGLGAPIPVSALSIDVCTRVVARLAEGQTRQEGKRWGPCGPRRQAQIMGAVYGAWAYGAAEPDRWPGLRPVPVDKARIIPRRPAARRPDPAPTIAEMDAILRCARVREQLFNAPFMSAFFELQRATGLRQFQVLALLVEDVLGLDTPVPRLRVRRGKSEQEDQGRIVPLAPVLVPTLRALVQGQPPGGLLLRRRSRFNVGTLVALLEEVEGAGELRPQVWRSESRGNRRTTHLWRAGHQRMLRRAGVEDRVINVLVGHVGKTTRDRSYDDADWSELVDAVRLIPAVDWYAVPNVTELRSDRPLRR